MALVNANTLLDSLKLDGDEAVGVNILRRALEAPLRQLVSNAGLEGAIVVERVKHEKPGVGLDVLTESYRDMFEAGIVDPTKVARSALQNAVSIAGMLLTTGALVAEIKEKEQFPAMPPPGAGGMGGMPY